MGRAASRHRNDQSFRVIGKAGDDTASAGAGDDRVNANKGNDFVDGGPGVDVCFGAETSTSCNP